MGPRLWRCCGLSAELLGLAGLRSPNGVLARGSRIHVTRDCMINIRNTCMTILVSFNHSVLLCETLPYCAFWEKNVAGETRMDSV
jgi:hypothetical protein